MYPDLGFARFLQLLTGRTRFVVLKAFLRSAW